MAWELEMATEKHDANIRSGQEHASRPNLFWPKLTIEAEVERRVIHMVSGAWFEEQLVAGVGGQYQG
jgi:hypothetical protein